jgi:hypothetical protein
MCIRLADDLKKSDTFLDEVDETEAERPNLGLRIWGLQAGGQY